MTEWKSKGWMCGTFASYTINKQKMKIKPSKIAAPPRHKVWPIREWVQLLVAVTMVEITSIPIINIDKPLTLVELQCLPWIKLPSFRVTVWVPNVVHVYCCYRLNLFLFNYLCRVAVTIPYIHLHVSIYSSIHPSISHVLRWNVGMLAGPFAYCIVCFPAERRKSKKCADLNAMCDCIWTQVYPLCVNCMSREIFDPLSNIIQLSLWHMMSTVM